MVDSFQFHQGRTSLDTYTWIVLSIGITFSHFSILLSEASESLELTLALITAGSLLQQVVLSFMNSPIIHRYETWLCSKFPLMDDRNSVNFNHCANFCGSFLFGAPGAVYITPAALDIRLRIFFG